MLRRLIARDVVLIEAADVAFAPGLNVLTGETGAGKSILLDALGLAIGARGDASLVRQGAERASVTAEFDLPAASPARAVLDEAGIAAGDLLVVRRVVASDGRSRAFIDDQPVTVGLLGAVGEALVEVHGQNDQRGLLRPEIHRDMLDAYGSHGPMRDVMAGAFGRWRESRAASDGAAAAAVERERERAAVEAVLAEFAALAPRAGEDAELAGLRARLANARKIAEALEAARTALGGADGAAERLRMAERAVARVAEAAAGSLDAAVAALAHARIEAGEALELVEAAGRGLDAEPRRVEEVEQRLFALRAVARKLGVAPDELPVEAERQAARLAALEAAAASNAGLGRDLAAAEAAVREAARALGAKREAAARELERRLAAELAPLKLGEATFRVGIEPRPFEAWSADGAERIVFQVATNPGAEPGPLNRIASGGELARFMLGLKVVLARAAGAAVLVFDEVDSGIGGAVADAVGARLARLGRDRQVLVVTHSPQIAARAGHHLRVVKDTRKGKATIAVASLDARAREEEIARMLAGAHVTAEARAAAESLIRAGAS